MFFLDFLWPLSQIINGRPHNYCLERLWTADRKEDLMIVRLAVLPSMCLCFVRHFMHVTDTLIGNPKGLLGWQVGVRQLGKKCNLTLAMSPTCHSNNTFFICWHGFFLECSQYELFSPFLVQSRLQTVHDLISLTLLPLPSSVFSQDLKLFNTNYKTGFHSPYHTAG